MAQSHRRCHRADVLRWDDGAIREVARPDSAIPWPELLRRSGQEITVSAEVELQGRAPVTGFARRSPAHGTARQQARLRVRAAWQGRGDGAPRRFR